MDSDLFVSRAFYASAGETDKAITPIGCGYEKCKPHYKRQRKNCGFHGLELVLQGKGKLEGAGKSWKLQKGCLFFYSMGSDHVYWNDRQSPFEKLWIVFQGREADVLMEPLLKEKKLFVIPALAMDFYQEIINQMLQLADRAQPRSWDIVAALVSALLLKALDDQNNQKHQLDRAYQLYLEAKSLIDNRFLTMDSAFELQEYLSVSKSYVCRIFKKYLGQSPHQYLLRKKLDRAAYLLLQNRESVKSISYDAGFTDPLYFSRLFKKYYGQSPEKFRGK